LQIHGACLTLAVFKDYGFGQIRIRAFLIVISLAVQTDNNVGVLLDSAGITQIVEHRALIASADGRTVELAEANDRNIKLLCHDLEHTAYIADRLLTVFVIAALAAGRLHELQIVDDHKAEV